MACKWVGVLFLTNPDTADFVADMNCGFEHFQFWILNSIEFRLNAVSKKLSDIEKKLNVEEDSSIEEA